MKYDPVEPYHAQTGEMRLLFEDFQYVLGAISPYQLALHNTVSFM